MEDGPEAQSDQSKMADGDEPNSVGSDSEQREIANMVLSTVKVEHSRGRCETLNDDDDITNRKVNRRRWWRRFSPSVVCHRKRKKDIAESLDRQKSYVPVPPEEALQETDITTLKSTEENMKETKGKRKFNMRMWPKFKRFLTSTDVQRTREQKRDVEEKDGDKTLMTIRKKMQKIFTRGEKSRSFSVPVENMEDVMKCEEAPCSPVAHKPTNDVTSQSLDPSVEVVMLAAEISIQLVEEEHPDQTATEEQLLHEISRSEPIQTEAADGPALPVQDLLEGSSSGKDVQEADDQLPTSTTSSPGDSQVQSEERTTDETTWRCFQPSTNGPFIRIELVPPDDVTEEEEEEDEEEECWEGSPSSENHNHLHLIGFEHSERQLLQTARCLVRAAMNAAVAQLTREQQSGSECVHREPPGCRDHA